MSSEIELKYRILEPAFETIKDFLKFEKLSQFTLGENQKKEIVDIYYDTKDFKISKSKSVLRIRVENFNTFYVTIKTSINVKDAVFERDEIEEILSEEFIEIVHKKLVDFGLELKVFDRFDYLNYGIWGMFKIWELHEIFVCENSRNIRNLYENEDLVAELSIDNVLISTFGRKEKFQEIEIEAKNNNSEKIEKLAVFIDENFKEKLIKGLQSKYETGIKLLLGNKIFEK